MSRVLLLTDKDMLYIRIVELIVKGANRSAGIAKDDIDTLRLQAFYHNFGTVDHAVCPSLCY